MRRFLLLFCFALVSSAFSQQATQSDPTAKTLLLQTAIAVSGGQAVSDVTLTGSGTWTLGPDRETGAVTLHARGVNQSRIALALGKHSRTEVQGVSPGGPACSWSGEDGVNRPAALHNCLTGAAWFFPALSALTGLTATDLQAQDLGAVTENGVALRHLRTWRTTSRATPTAQALFQRLSTVDFYLDPKSFLPLIVRFNVHPDDDARRDIPVEIRYTDYRSIDGVQVPFRIQKRLSGALILDIVISSAQLNTGLAESLFTVE